MNNKSFQQQVERAQTAILAENQEWYEKVLKENCEPTSEQPQKADSKSFKKKAFWISLCSSLVAACIIVISVWMFHPSPIESPPKRYLGENRRVMDIETFDQIDDIRDVSLHFDNIYTQRIKKIYDSDSNDTLYYTVELGNEDITFEDIIVYVYVNPDFQDKKSLQGITDTQTINGLNVQYYNEIIVGDWANEIIYNARIVYKDTEILINYKQYSMDESSNFFHFLEQTITKKA